MKKTLKNNQGQALTEYILILVLVSLVSVLTAASLGKKIKDKMATATKWINTEINFSEHEKVGTGG